MNISFKNVVLTFHMLKLLYRTQVYTYFSMYFLYTDEDMILQNTITMATVVLCIHKKVRYTHKSKYSKKNKICT